MGPDAGADASERGLYSLAPDRMASWCTAGVQRQGAADSAPRPPCNETPLSPGGGDDSQAINALIDRCPEGSAVTLGPGTFRMGKGKYVALRRGVVLRGAGAGVTVLENQLNQPATKASQSATDAVPIIVVGRERYAGVDGDSRCTGPTRFDASHMQRLTRDGRGGDRSVTVGAASIFAPGQIVLLDETSNASWQPDVAGASRSIWASSDYGVTWMKHDPPNEVTRVIDDPVLPGVVPSAANNFAGAGTGTDAACWFSRQDRPQSEIKEIVGVQGDTITFDTPLSRSYRTANYAEVATFTGSNQHLRGAGVEALTVVGGGDGGIVFSNAAYCWARKVEVSGWYGAGVAFDHSFRAELRDSYVHDAAWPEPGGAGYAISLAYGSSEILIEDDIALRANKVIVVRAAGASSVVAYSYMDDAYIATTETFIESGINGSHMVGSHHMLFEGNASFNIDSDTTHGNATYHTFFRNFLTTVRARFDNRYTGHAVDDSSAQDDGPKRAVSANVYSYDMSFVGNVLGRAGVVTPENGYVDEIKTKDWGAGKGAIWLLGWNAKPPYSPDPRVEATAVRDGNWDTLLGRQTWLTSGKATPLPDSLYRKTKPKFFGASPWPWMDPSTGTVGTLPAKARYDAGRPNDVP
jgi:hypothetical protein